MLRRRNSNNDQQPSILLRLILGLAILSALPAIHQRHARVLARPAMATIEVEEQSEEQQLVELIDQQQNNKKQQTSGTDTSEILDDKFISYGLRDNNAREREQQLQDAFFELDPEPRVGKRPSSTTDAVDRGRIWLANGGGSGAREQKTNRRNGQREEERQHLGDEDSATPPLHGGMPMPPLTSAGVVNSTLLQASNCRGDLFKHKVRVLGCRPKFFTNRFCHGSCSSVYIPRLRSKKLKATFQSCAACVPSETDLIQVRLDCPDHPQGQKLRTVVRVKKCACRNIVLDDPPEDEPPLHEDGDELPGTDSDDEGVATVVEEEEEDE